MNRLNLRRSVAVIAGALIGLAGVAVVAAPASAHHSEVKVTAECDTAKGEWVTTWTVRTYAPQGVNRYKLTKVEAVSKTGATSTPFTIDGIQVTEGASYPHEVSQSLVGTARLAGDVTEASLTVRAQWDNTYQENDDKSASIKFSESCDKVVTPPPAKANPTATVTSDCTGDVAVKLENGAEATKDASFTITGTDGFTKTADVAPGKSTSIRVPAKNAAHIKVTEAGLEQPLFDDKPAEAKDCVEPGEPSGSYMSTCDELIFQIENPKDGKTVEVTFTPNKGEAQKLVVQPGETKTVKFKAFEGLTVTPTAEGLDDSEPIAWEKPADCTPGTGGGKEDGPTLPLTGAATGGIVAGAIALLAAGAVLFVVARRRKLRFTV
ncbi:LPXTG cell wall anchor domain-containing protein [Micromonospora yasonensis]|uniref:LPXTG cell wall anchor domain-containing protein n=1 Tax=Micromonospora yasonensis TaxID=1128667 RepID=UPI002232771A|nr:LPXTG cell wall anchor domain-containing protein [Micromonospora yasonensis]MCW3840739.1 LPXTG cell wall anchor domain-containing protein [Micromonospora yasonensis]